MWWQVAFWILLVPVIVIETIIYWKTKRVSWLIYTLAIFAYVIAVSYTMDVFNASRNVILLVLVASAALMSVLGRQMQKSTPQDTRIRRWAALSLSVVLLTLMLISVFFGTLEESIAPVASVSAKDVASYYDEKGMELRYTGNSVMILKRTLKNNFFLPVPVVSKQYSVCLISATGMQSLYANFDYSALQNLEIWPGETRTLDYTVSPARLMQTDRPEKIHVFERASKDYSQECTDNKTPLYIIPVTPSVA